MPGGILIKSNRKKWIKLADATAREMTSPSLLNAMASVIRFRMQTFNRMAFSTEGGSTAGGRWRRLSPQYEKSKASSFPGKTILRREDRLYRSYTSSGGEHLFSSLRSGGRMRVRIGSSVPYAGFHPDREVQNPTVAQLFLISGDIGKKIIVAVRRKGWVDKDNGRATIKNTGFDRTRV